MSVPKRGLARSSSIVALAAGVARHELSHRVKSRLGRSARSLGLAEATARVAQARLLVDNLGRLKGALMKAGQLLSIEAGDWLPPEASEVLGRLQADAEPVAFETIHRVLLRELGPDKLGLLRDLSPEPAASASIGQVHRASYQGRPVAVKVQYPGIVESIDADVELVAKLSSGVLSLTRSQIELREVFDELRTLLHQEADYNTERAYLHRFRKLLQADSRFVVPSPVDELSGQRVFTMSWEDGVALGDWMRLTPAHPERAALGTRLLDLYCCEFFEWGLVQTDPNPGNFLVRPEDGSIVLLDFGASVEYEPEFRRRYVELLRCVERGDRAGVIDVGVEFGLLDARESPETRQRFADLLESSAAPFEPGRQPFSFRDARYAAEARDVLRQFVRGLEYSPPPRRLIFLHRKLGGLFNLLKKLDLSLDLVPYWQRMIGSA